MISISLLLPSHHPPLGSNHLPDDQRPVRQTYHSWKLKYGNIQKSLREDLDLDTSSILQTLKNILDNTKNLSPQDRADMACKLVGSVLPNQPLASSLPPTSIPITHIPANPPLPHPNTTLDTNKQIPPPMQKPYARKSKS